ncbi:MAG: adenylyltransferase/cytidyltransferase family protein [Thermodesulfobacteriota bacterium]|nr:adenylyltransferase/cytidyltransferase family protein [Thermodesulfobacteriota bacterium]
MKTGITFSTFDLLHAGHIAMLKEAKQHCDYLICGLHVDPQVERPEKNSPIQSVVERYLQLSAVKYVDEIVPYNLEKDLADILLTFPINIRIIGADYKDTDFSGKQLCIDNNIEIYYNSRSHNFSSSGLRKRVFNEEEKNNKQKRT